MNTLETNDDSNIIEIDNKYWHDLYLALKRLEENKDFQKLILETYFKDKAVNLVSMLANPHVVNTNKRGEIMEEIGRYLTFARFLYLCQEFGCSCSRR